MRKRWQVANVRAALRRHWRLRPATLGRGEVAGLDLYPLEERRVLSAAAALALAQAFAADGMDQVEGTAKSPEVATPLGTDVAHDKAIEPGERAVQGDPQAGTDNSDGPAAENLDESENRSTTDSEVAADVIAEVAQEAGLSLTVVGNQTSPEGNELSITNLGTFSDDSGGTEYTYTINWGDGTTTQVGIATIDSPGGDNEPLLGSFDGSHTYADNGTYTVQVTIDNGLGDVEFAQFTVRVNNVAPTLTVAPNQTIDEGDTVSLEDIGSFTDPGFDNDKNVGGETQEQFTYVINWGDGSAEAFGLATIDTPGSAGQPTRGSFDGSHTYADNGVYTVTVTVSDDDGATVQKTFTVTVRNVEPDLTLVGNQTVNEGTELNLPNLGTFTDPGFDNPDNEGGETEEQFTYTIDWGDGSDLEFGPVTDVTSGGPGEPTTGSFGGSHTYADNGVYTVTVTLSDDDGATVQKTFTVTVRNVDPVLTVVPNQIVNEGTELVIPDIGTFTDPGFDNDKNVGGETEEKFTYTIDWGDGSDLEFGEATIDVHGQPGVLTQGSFDGSHTYADNGVYTVTVTISDDDGGSDVKTFTVTVRNVAPSVIVAPNQQTDEGTRLDIPDIVKFSDPGFDNDKNVGGETEEKFTYVIDWGDGTPPEFGEAPIDIPGGPGVPTQGSLDGSHVYADNGVYTVTITISDDDGGTTVATLTVTVRNVAPDLIVPDECQIIVPGGTVHLTPTFTDPGFDNPANEFGETMERFTYHIDWGDGTEDFGSVTDYTTGGILPDGTPYPSEGQFPVSHTFNAPGDYTVTVTVADDDGGVTVRTVCVKVRDDGNPRILEIEGIDQTTAEGALLDVDQIAVFQDTFPSGFPYAYTIDWGDGTLPDDGLVSISGFEGSFGGAHIYADNGVYPVTVTIMSADGRFDSDTLTVTVDNVDPTLTVPQTHYTVKEDVPFVVAPITFTDPGFDNLMNPGPEKMETFEYEIDWGDGTTTGRIPVTNYTTGERNPGGLSAVLSSGEFLGSHAYAEPGTYKVTVTVYDDDLGSDTAEIWVVVERPGIVVIVAENQTVDEGSLLSVNPIARFYDGRVDGGGAPYTYTINWGDGRPQDSGDAFIVGGEVNFGMIAGAHTYADDGWYPVTVTIYAADGRIGTCTLYVQVNNVAPTITEVAPNQSIPLTTPLRLTDLVKFSDPGFDNPLNQQGETRETFTYEVRWGDGTPIDVGDGDIDLLGAIGQRTLGSLDGGHLYGDVGVFNVNITVFDDDGGVATASLQVDVFFVPTIVIFSPPGGGTIETVSPTPGPIDALPLPPNPVLRFEPGRVRVGSVAGAELRLVLRVVLPDGLEEIGHDERLREEVLDNLRTLFHRLPDGHYRIYLIQADDIERLVVDVIIHQGRSITLFDDSESLRNELGDEPPARPAEELPPLEQNKAGGAPAAESDAANRDAGNHGAADIVEPDQTEAAGLAFGAGLGVSLRSPLARLRRARRSESPSLKKTHRILRRARGTDPLC